MTPFTNDITDENLLKLLATDDTHALEKLYDRHSSRIYSYALKRVASKQDAEEIIQLVFMQLFKKRELYKPQFTALQWIYVITRSTCQDYLKKERKHQTLEINLELLSQNEQSSLNNKVEFDSVALESLPKESQSALKMRYFEDKEFEEIAKILGKSEANVRQMISRALKKIRLLVLEKGEHKI